MLLGRLAHRISPTPRIGIRLSSTIVGKSGREYIQREVLSERKDTRSNIFKAESHDQSFVFKRVPESYYDVSLRIAADFPESRRLRLHVDYNDEGKLLIYPYYQNTLLRLLQEDPGLSDAARKKVLRHTAEAIQELHSKDWIHNDVKPDNILVNWTCDNEGTKTITDVALGDFDISWQCPTGAVLMTPNAVGNAMWRSPESQTGRGLSKASDVYSFGLVCIYTLGAEGVILIADDEEIVKRNLVPEQRVLLSHFMYFGSANEGLFKHIADEKWTERFNEVSQFAESKLKEHPYMSFEMWGHELGSEVQKMIAGTTKIDPGARSTMDQVLAHPWWQEAV